MLASGALKRVAPHSPPHPPARPPAQMPPMPEELSEWARDTMLATFFGVVLSGGRQWMQERSSGPVQAPAAAATKAHAARAMAEEQTQRLARIANASTR